MGHGMRDFPRRTELPPTGDDAYELAENLRATIAANAIFQSDDGTRATINIDVTTHQSEDTIDTMLARVDKAFYRAKREGRNCVRVANEHDIWADLVAAE
jgi:PleD family two-component response regulator